MPRRISAHTPHNAVRTARIPRRLLWTVCFLSAALCIWQLAVYKGACMNMGDAYSYYGAYDHLRHLQLDDIRPPVYPLFYGIMYAIFGQHSAPSDSAPHNGQSMQAQCCWCGTYACSCVCPA